MERHRCKLCFRIFANGRALGGHMRSHMMSFYASKNSSNKEEVQVPSEEKFREIDEFQSVISYSLSSSSSEEEKKTRNDSFVADQEFPVVLQDGESETESSEKNFFFCRRSKRIRKSRICYSDRFPVNDFSQVKKSKSGETNEQSPLSSISDTTPEQEVAYCLMMLSRDSWKKQKDCFEDSDVLKVKKTKVRGRYSCETCSKFFRSYQALGGHRASHKKIKVTEAAPQQPNSGRQVVETAAVVEEKIHKCPFCDRVFASGQALGGHKRSHFIGSAAISGNVGTISPIKQFSESGEILDIDLNLPTPTDDAEDNDISH